MTDLATIADQLAHAFPGIHPIAPLRLLGEGFGSTVVVTAGGLVFRIARTADAGARFATEMENLPRLTLPVAIPTPRWYILQSSAFPYGLMGYPMLAGTPLEPDEIVSPAEARALAGEIAALMLALHRTPPDSLRLSSTRHPPEWAFWREVTMPALREALTPGEYQAVERWWQAFSGDDRMTPDTSVVHHGDLWYGNMLLENGHITGLLDFEQLGLGDPAVDFVPQLYLGETFFSWVVEAYTRSGGGLSAHFRHRVTQLFAVREFSGLHWAIEHHDVEEFHDSVMKIRKGPILNPAGLDGWHRDFGAA